MKSSAPLWFKAIIIVLMLPLALYPSLLGRMGAMPDYEWLIKLYPAYVIASAVCAWIVYPQRRDVAWVLVALLLLSHIGVYFAAIS